MSERSQTITTVKTIITQNDFLVYKDGLLHVGMFRGNTRFTLRGVLERTKYNLSKNVYAALDILKEEQVSENVTLVFFDISSLEFGDHVYFKTIKRYILQSVTEISGKVYVVDYCPKETGPTMCITGFFPDETKEYIVFSEPIVLNGNQENHVFYISHGDGLTKNISMMSVEDNTKILSSTIGVFCLREEHHK